MAIVCRACGGDIVQPLADTRAKCLTCGKFIDQETGAELEGGLCWTSDVPENHAEQARRTVEASK